MHFIATNNPTITERIRRRCGEQPWRSRNQLVATHKCKTKKNISLYISFLVTNRQVTYQRNILSIPVSVLTPDSSDTRLTLNAHVQRWQTSKLPFCFHLPRRAKQNNIDTQSVSTKGCVARLTFNLKGSLS